MSTPRVFIDHFCTLNDTNGNPRRIFRVIDARGENDPIVLWFDEGYNGDAAIPKEYREASKTYLGRIYVTPGEYRDMKRLTSRKAS